MNRNFLEALGLEKDMINKIMAEHGKTINEKNEELTALKNQVDELTEKVGDSDDAKKKHDELASKVAELMQQLKEKEEKEQADREKKEQEKKDKSLSDKVNEVLKDKTFVNDFTKNAIANELKNKLKDNESIDLVKSLEEMTKDSDNIFANKHKQGLNISPTENGEGEEDKNDKLIRKVMGLD